MVNIKLNNNEYPIPESALVAPKAAFVSHLGTIAGNDLKITIDGVEYGIDASKVADAVAAFESALNGLESEDSDSEETQNIYWDRNMDGRVVYPHPYEALYQQQMGPEVQWRFVKVSDKLFTEEEIKQASITMWADGQGEESTPTENYGIYIADDQGFIAVGSIALIIFYDTEPHTLQGLTLQAPEPGTYFVYQHVPNQITLYTTALTFPQT